MVADQIFDPGICRGLAKSFVLVYFHMILMCVILLEIFTKTFSSYENRNINSYSHIIHYGNIWMFSDVFSCQLGQLYSVLF